MSINDFFCWKLQEYLNVFCLVDGRGDGGGKEWLSSKSRSRAARPSKDDANEQLGLDPLK